MFWVFLIILVDIATLREVIGASTEKQTDNPCSGVFDHIGRGGGTSTRSESSNSCR